MEVGCRKSRDEIYTSTLDEINDLRRLLNGYIAFLKRSKRGESEPGANIPDPAIEEARP